MTVGPAASIRIGIIGWGNLGKGAALAIARQPDMSLEGIFTRRDPVSLESNHPIYALSDLDHFQESIDVCLLCGGSASDLDVQGPDAARRFHTVDSFDTHTRIPEYFGVMDAAARRTGHLALISAGWDPGLFSLLRLYGAAVLPAGETATFWGKGVSQGHSEAIRRLPGVAAAVQYTVPSESALERFQRGETPSGRERHRRECFVVLEEDADARQVRQAIVTMPHYFADYETTVTFVSREELSASHAGMPHGGRVMRIGETSPGVRQSMEFALELDSNPEFTASIQVAAARAVWHLAAEGRIGAITMFDVPPGLLSASDPAELRRTLL